MTNSETPQPVLDALQYADDVIAGEIVAGEMVKSACRRFLSDLKRQGKKSFPYVFDLESAARACLFISCLPHIAGIWAKRGETIDLEPWQSFIVCNLFGWIVDRDLLDDETGMVAVFAGSRRFRNAYIEVARKNAKSTLAAGIALYMLLADSEEGAEVYSAATTRKQAQIVWRTAKRMVEKSTSLRKRFPVKTGAHSIACEENGGIFEALHAQGETLDGLNIHGAIIDELHAHKTREVYDVIETACGSREQPLLFNITTAGFNRAGICFEIRTYATKILDRVLRDEQFFCAIYTLDEGDDIFDESVWPKANPNYGISVFPFDMRALARKASETPAAENNFATKRCNVWCNAESAWLNMRAWDAQGDSTLNEADFVNDPCWIGADLASKVDLTAIVRVYVREIDGQPNLYVFPSFYLPAASIEGGRNSQYEGWKKRGILTATPGNIIDMDQIEADVLQMVERCGDFRQLAYDPLHNATQWASHLVEEGIECVEVRPTVMYLSEPMKWIEAMTLDGRIHHPANECLTWNMSNICVEPDRADNIFPRKQRVENKIDGAIALIMATNRVLADDDEGSVYDDRGVRML